MKKTITFCCSLFLIGILCSNAQKNKDKNFSKIRTLKVNFISEELELTPETAAVFWPIFNAYEKTNRKLKSQEIYPIRKELNNSESLTDTQAQELLKKLQEFDKKILKNKNNFFAKLKPILSSKQLLKLYFTEGNFNRKVIRRLNNSKGKK